MLIHDSCWATYIWFLILFYCGVKQKAQLQMNTIREACKRENIKFHKATRTHSELCQLLGKSLLT